AERIFQADVLVGANGAALAGACQDALGAGVQDAAGAGFEGRVEDVHGAAVVDLREVAAAVRPQVGVGGQVIDQRTTPHRLDNGGAVAHVGEHHVDAVE